MQTLLSPEEIATQTVGEDSPNRLPPTGVFANRAERLRALAGDHAMADFLLFCARIADLQQQELERLRPLTARPDAALLKRCREHGMPPLDAQGGELPEAWFSVLQHLATALDAYAPPVLQSALLSLPGLERSAMDELARSILRCEEAPDTVIELALAPLVGAALQVAWTARALALAESDIPAGFEDSLCPACGAHPVASIVRIGDAGHGVRYATCSLCACEWHVTRIKCVPCHNTKGISYQSLEGQQGAVHPGVKAETCPECHASLKIVSMEKDPLVDAFADDLATLALDMLVDEAGFHRAGRNLFLFTP